MKKYLNGKMVEIVEEEMEKMLTPTVSEVVTEIEMLKQNLNDTDYIIIKIIEGVATKEEYSDIISKRQSWRERINELQMYIDKHNNTA